MAALRCFGACQAFSPYPSRSLYCRTWQSHAVWRSCRCGGENGSGASCPINLACSSAAPEQDEGSNVSLQSMGRRRAMVTAAMMPVVSFFLGFGLPQSLPGLEAIAAEDEILRLERIRGELRKVISKSKAAGILRLAFHDAGTFNSAKKSGGMNGSIVYELERPENMGLKRSIRVLQKVKDELDPTVPVSWADLIAVAGAVAVAECDGPQIPVKLGRVDSFVPDPEGEMPEETLSASALKQCFQSKGFTTQELVVLSGAHTLGNKGFGNPNLFDSSYFQILLQKPWKNAGAGDETTVMTATMTGLPTDRALSDDNECLVWLQIYAEDQGRFFKDFSAAYLKLVDTGAQREPIQA